MIYRGECQDRPVSIAKCALSDSLVQRFSVHMGFLKQTDQFQASAHESPAGNYKPWPHGGPGEERVEDANEGEPGSIFATSSETHEVDEQDAVREEKSQTTADNDFSIPDHLRLGGHEYMARGARLKLGRGRQRSHIWRHEKLQTIVENKPLTERKEEPGRLQTLWSNLSGSLDFHSLGGGDQDRDSQGNGRAGHTSNKVAPVPSQTSTSAAGKEVGENSLTLASEYSEWQDGKGKGSFDIVAVSFWLALLQQGCPLYELKKQHWGRGKLRVFFVQVETKGSVSLTWRSGSFFGKSRPTVELMSTEAVDSDRWEFRLVTGEGDVYARARDNETFELWTLGMTSIFAYARAYRQKRRADLRKVAV